MNARELRDKLVETNKNTIQSLLEIRDKFNEMTEEEKEIFQDIAWRDIDGVAFNGAWALDFLADNRGLRTSWRSKFRKLLGYGG